MILKTDEDRGGEQKRESWEEGGGKWGGGGPGRGATPLCLGEKAVESEQEKATW